MNIGALVNLDRGWSYGRGVSFSPEVIELAANLAREAGDLGFQIDASPGLGGEIQVDVYGEANDLELIIEADCSITVTRETKAGDVVRNIEGLSYEAAIDQLREF